MDMKARFKACYHVDADRVYFSPGRVNIIGEHIDYNGGLVFPAAISIGTYGAIKSRTDNIIHFYSNNFKEQGIVTVDLEHLSYQESHGWTNYAKGVIQLLIQRGNRINHGFDLIVDGNLPHSSGLSSSASLELLIAYAMNDLFELNLSREAMALIGQAVENDYMGMHCGIMDQLIIAKGVLGKALIMNTKTLETTPVNASFDGYTWVIMNTNYKRKNTDSKYNERVKECQIVLKKIREIHPYETLCDVSKAEFENLKSFIKEDTLQRRFKHVVFEQSRVIEAKKKMEQRDAIGFGQLLNASHESLKHDYEVTGPHLDALVEGAHLAGAIGARVTGAGFGGCAIALVPNAYLNEFPSIVQTYYFDRTGLIPSFYDVIFVNGVNRLE